MSNLHVERKLCRLCSKWVSPHDVIGASIRGYTCRKCLEWHFRALDFLGGAVPPGCQGCGKTTDELKTVNLAGEVSIRLLCHPRDGVYQLLCPSCSKAYSLKRKDLYRGSSYGDSLKI